MREKMLVLVLMMAMVIGASLFAGPPTAEADTIFIRSIAVQVGGQTWCNTGNATCNAAHQIWDLGAVADGSVGNGSVTLNSGQSLILTQTSGFNFDSSEGNAPACGPGTPCATSLSINAVAPSNPGSTVLANNNIDDASSTHNEAANWALTAYPLVGGFGAVYFGYADNIHTNACADGGNCLPNSAGPPTVPNTLWQGTATYFIGAGTSGTGLGVVQGDATTHCSTSVASTSCFDAGAILIYNTQPVPEPVTMFLGGTGLILLGYAARRRLFAR